MAKRSTNFNGLRKVRRVASSAEGLLAAVRFVERDPKKQRELLERMLKQQSQGKAENNTGDLK